MEVIRFRAGVGADRSNVVINVFGALARLVIRPSLVIVDNPEATDLYRRDSRGG